MVEKILTKTEKRLLSVGEDIACIEPMGKDIGFSHSILCQVGFPRSKAYGTQFMRTDGDAWLNIQSGYLDFGHGPEIQIIPYGAYPRLALAYLSTDAIKNKSQKVFIGKSPRQFLKNLGIDPQTSAYKNLEKQFNAMAACRLQLGFNGVTYGSQPVKQIHAWKTSKEDIKTPWDSSVFLSDEFYTSLIEHAVPFDYRSLIALKHSCLAMDIYSWLCQRLYRIESGSRYLTWSTLRLQFASEYTGSNAPKTFKVEFLKGLKKALIVYPTAKVRVGNRGITLFSSPPPINTVF